MRLVVTLLVRDEADIIAATIEHHVAAGADHIIVTDNGSVDGTVEIVERYAQYTPLTLLHEPAQDYSQSQWVTRMARRAADELAADWVINADADEFWWPLVDGSLRETLARVPADFGTVEVQRENLVAHPERDGAWPSRLVVRDLLSLHERGARIGPKTCHRAAADIVVHQGNHGLSSASLAAPWPGEPMTILHVPDRSYQQFARKIHNGGTSLTANRVLDAGSGWHWRADHARLLDGTLQQAWHARQPTSASLAEGLAAGRLVVDSRLHDRLSILVDRAVLPDELTKVMEPAAVRDGTTIMMGPHCSDPGPSPRASAQNAVGGPVLVSQDTSVRHHGERRGNGWILLRDPGSDYADGAEETLLKLVRDADDVSAFSDELISLATDWPTNYHLSPARANALRSLDLPANAKVLEIGAGCGAVTRYLGEVCAVVDALEPVPARAAVARERTRDLPNVEVFVGEIDDVPVDDIYDLVIVVGVLEYVGRGSSDPAPYRDFLSSAASRLRAGGQLILAIENKLGVKYLVGAPEDHTGRVFDSIEGYPQTGVARTFSRAELQGLLSDAGLSGRFFSVFPDYKMTRAVLGDFPAEARSLFYRIPTFPSPDWSALRPRLADERRVWRSLVEAGHDVDFANSLLVAASKAGDHSPSLWPDERAGVFYSCGRKAVHSTQTFVVRDEGVVRFQRFTGVDIDRPEQVRAFEPGVDLVDLLGDPTVDIGALLEQWISLLREPGNAMLDFVPHNLVVDDDRRVHPIDIEFTHTQLPTDQVVRRGLLWLAIRGAENTFPELLPGVGTVGDFARQLGDLLGLTGPWIDRAVEEEALIQASVQIGPPANLTHDEWVAAIATDLSAALARPLNDLPLGQRLPEAYEVMARSHQAADDQLMTLTTSKAFRVLQSYRQTIERLLPPDTRRRAAYARVITRFR